MSYPRAPRRMRDRVLKEFRSKENLDYLVAAFTAACRPGGVASPAGEERLNYLLKTLDTAVDRFASGQGEAILDSDPLAVRGTTNRGSNTFEELGHLNRVFFVQRMQFASTRSEITRGVALTDGGPGKLSTVAGEPLYYQMFVADSLHPPGLEHLNGPGPWERLLESQAAYSLSSNKRYGTTHDPSIPEADQAWEPGSRHRTAEQAVADYYGVDSPMQASMGLSSTPQALKISVQKDGGEIVTTYDVSHAAYSAPCSARKNGSVSGWDAFQTRPSSGPVWDEPATASARRFQRRESIPYWQRNGRRPELLSGRWQSAGDGDEGTVEETLGSGSAEFGGERCGHVRGWDMRRLKDPRGESYLTHGPTS